MALRHVGLSWELKDPTISPQEISAKAIRETKNGQGYMVNNPSTKRPARGTLWGGPGPEPLKFNEIHVISGFIMGSRFQPAGKVGPKKTVIKL